MSSPRHHAHQVVLRQKGPRKQSPQLLRVVEAAGAVVQHSQVQVLEEDSAKIAKPVTEVVTAEAAASSAGSPCPQGASSLTGGPYAAGKAQAAEERKMKEQVCCRHHGVAAPRHTL